MDKREVYLSMDKPHLYTLSGASMVEMAGRQMDALWPLLTWPKQPLPVLDVGCGPGDIARKVLAPRLPPGTKLVACDICPEMLEFGRQHNALPGTITYELLDVLDPHLERSAVWPHAPFGKVFCLLLLHWLPDNRPAIQNIHKLLAPGGEAVFSVISNMAFYTAYEEMSKDPRWAQEMQDLCRFVSPYQHCEDAVGVFSQLLESEGFQVLHCEVRPQVLGFQGPAQRRDFLKSVCAFWNRLPEDRRDECLDDWIQHSEKLKGIFTDAGRSEDQRYCFRINVMVAVARKL